MIIIFWDYDGTLVDTETVYKRSLEAFFETNNYILKDIDDGYFYKNIAGNHPETFLKLLERDGYIKPNLNINPMEIKEHYTKYFANLDIGEIKITDGIDFVIDSLSKNDKVVMCITSSSYTRDFTIKHKNVANRVLNTNFSIDKNVYLCGSIEGCKFKPEPDLFVFALNDIINRYNLQLSDKDKVIVLEDSITGCKAGKQFKNLYGDKINISVIGYLGGAKLDNSKVLLNSGADIIIKNSSELLKYFEKTV